MKKFIVLAMIAAFMTFGAAAADADEMLYGFGLVLEICVYESCTDDIPDQPCEVEMIFITENLQVYFISATACGTQLNLALLKTGFEGLIFDVCLRYRFVTIPDCDSSCFSVEFEIVWICLPFTPPIV